MGKRYNPREKRKRRKRYIKRQRKKMREFLRNKPSSGDTQQ